MPLTAKPNRMKIILVLFFFFLTTAVFAQPAQELRDFNARRISINKTGMLVLGSWALANMATNAGLLSNATGETRFFYQMNVFWNVVNLGLAVPGYLAALRSDPATFHAYNTLQEHYDLEKTFLLNTGLDVGYMVTGFFLMERGNTSLKNNDLLKGYGKSLVLQGAFLFAFDLAMFGIHHSHLGKSRMLFENLKLSGNSAGIELRF